LKSKKQQTANGHYIIQKVIQATIIRNMTTNEKGYKNFSIPAPTEFEDVFFHFYVAKNNTGQSVTKILLPSYQTILIFCFGAKASLITRQNTKIEIEKCLVLGPVKQAFEYTLTDGAEILVVNFKNDAFYRFFGNAVLSDPCPMHPDELLEENCFTNLWYKLKRINSSLGRIKYILEFSKPYLRDRNVTAERLTDFKDEALSPIKAIAQETVQSERNIQLKHKKYLGYSAKEINRYHRFLKAAELIQNMAENAAKMDWFEVINACGYYDQSHLIRDFKHFLNLAPKQFLNFQQEICIPKPD